MMNPQAKQILQSDVVEIDSFHRIFSSRISTEGNNGWGANFKLRSGHWFAIQGGNFSYTCAPHHTNIDFPEVKYMSWNRPKETGFGGRGCGFKTGVKLVNGSSEADKKAYLEILTPTVIDEGSWVPYPKYRYLPLLETAFKIQYACEEREKMARKLEMAQQNLADVLALRKASYDLERE